MSGLLNVENLILARDLNFTTPAKIWGHNVKVDLLVEVFNKLLERFDLVNIIFLVMYLIGNFDRIQIIEHAL